MALLTSPMQLNRTGTTWGQSFTGCHQSSDLAGTWQDHYEKRPTRNSRNAAVPSGGLLPT